MIKINSCRLCLVFFFLLHYLKLPLVDMFCWTDNIISLFISEYCMIMMMKEIMVMITMHLQWPSTVQVFPCRHIGSHALPKMISGSQSHGAYSGGVPGSIFLMAL